MHTTLVGGAMHEVVASVLLQCEYIFVWSTNLHVLITFGRHVSLHHGLTSVLQMHVEPYGAIAVALDRLLCMQSYSMPKRLPCHELTTLRRKKHIRCAINE